MPKIIYNDEQLRTLIPNQLVTVKGETPLFDKLVPFLSLAEDFVKSTFTSEPVFNTICSYNQTNAISQTTARLVVADAMCRAIPSLDVVLTPNGFATVGTQNLVAASKMRIDRLVASMSAHRDECIAALLEQLPAEPKWLSTKQAAFFGKTLFPTLALVDCTDAACNSSKWLRYLDLRTSVMDIEASLAEEWLSPELLDTLRANNLNNTLSPEQKYVTDKVTAQIIACLKTGSLSSRRLADIVTYIRHNPDCFPEWVASQTAKLFSPPVFQNKKDAPGYFF